MLAEITPGIVAADPWDYAQAGAVNFAAEAVWDLRADELAPPMLECARRLLEAGAGDYYMASTELTVARLEALLGRGEGFARARRVGRRARPDPAARDRRPRRRDGARVAA